MELRQQYLSTPNGPQQIKEQQQQLLYNPTGTFNSKHLQQATRHVDKQQIIFSRVLTTLFFISLVLLLTTCFQGSKQSSPLTLDAKPVTIKAERLPRIFWIYTENQKEAEPMQNDIYLNYFAHIAKKAGYQVRYANSWNSYDWLTPQTIALVSKTMQNSKIDQTVHSMLKLALLLENGGLMAGWGNMFLAQDFTWIQQMFDKYQGNPILDYTCQPQQSFLFLLQKPHNIFGTLFSQGLIAAVPNSPFLRESLQILSQIITTGVFPFEDELNVFEWNQDTSINFMPQSLSKVMSVVAYKHRKMFQKGMGILCQLGIQSTKSAIAFEYPREDQFHLVHTLTSRCGWQRYLTYKQKILQKAQILLLSGINQPALKSYLGSLIQETTMLGDLSAQSLLYRILSVQGNKEVFLDPFPKKAIQLCLVLMEPLNQMQLQQTVTAFDKQTFKKWKIIVPTYNISQYRQLPDQRVIKMSKQSNKVHNIEKAVAKFCQPKGYAVLLNQGEYFNSYHALQQIAKAVEPRHVVGLYLSLSHKGCPMHPKKRYANFDRQKDGIINPRLDIMKHFLNHFRVISVQTFLLLPQFAMRDMYGRYFEDRIIFLMDLLDQVKEALTSPNQIFVIKKYWDLWEVPQKVEILTSSIILSIKQLEEVNLQQLKITRTRINSACIGQQLRSTLAWKVPFTKLIARNPGDDFVSVDDRPGPNIIPKIIHQAWLGSSELPPAKKYFYEKTRKMYPEYEIKLWREENITREAFPLAYDVIKTLINFNKRSPYNKLASVTDIIRHEILYHEGGFWKDAGMNFLRPILDKFLKFKLVLPVDRIFKYRYLQGMCFFGNIPKYENLMKITGYRNINRMRIYRVNPLLVAGPVDFRQLLQGQEEYDPDILLLPYETFYPGQVGQHPQNDLCTKRKKNMRHDEQYEVKQNGWYLLSNCEDLYPYAFGIEHNHYGSTWQKRTPK